MSKPCHFPFKIKMKHKSSLSVNQILWKNLIFSLFYCLHTSTISILLQLIVKYGNYSNKHRTFRCSPYQKGGAYQRETLISMWITKDAAFIRWRRLFEARCLLEEIRYQSHILYILKKKSICMIFLRWILFYQPIFGDIQLNQARKLRPKDEGKI